MENGTIERSTKKNSQQYTQGRYYKVHQQEVYTTKLFNQICRNDKVSSHQASMKIRSLTHLD